MKPLLMMLALLTAAIATPALAQVDPRAAPIKEALAVADKDRGTPYYLGPTGNGNPAALTALYGPQFNTWLPHLHVLQDLIASGAKRCPQPRLTGREVVNAPGSPVTSELRAAIFRKGDEQRRNPTLDPVDLASAPGGQALVDYWACRATAPIVEPLRRITIEGRGIRVVE